jgi:hypothetical protein
MNNFHKICLILCLAFSAFGCQTAVTPVANLQTPTPTPTPADAPKTGDEDAAEKLEYVQKGAFEFVYVFRRKDGGALDGEDRKYLRFNSPVETNQWVVSDDGKTAIAGSNYQFPWEMLDALKKRFNVEDLSKPQPQQPETNPEASSNAENKFNSNASNEVKSNSEKKANSKMTNTANSNANK